MNRLKLLTIFLIVIIVSNHAISQTPNINLKTFYESNSFLDRQVDNVFNTLNDNTQVVQMIITSAGELGKPEDLVYNLTRTNKIDGVVFFKGPKQNHNQRIDGLNTISNSLKFQLQLIFYIDAESSLFNGRLKGTQPLMPTAEIKTIKESDFFARIINKDLLEIGINQNFTPVCDVRFKKASIKDRCFGAAKDEVIALSKQFIETIQSQGIVATTKHFPGHGLVEGDTNKQSVYINGDLKELEVYPLLMEGGVLSIIMATYNHKNNTKYNTEDLYASCSRTIVTDLLKEKLGFKGIIRTDTLNIMKAINIIDNAPLYTLKAGCVILLMPIYEEGDQTFTSVEEVKRATKNAIKLYNSKRLHLSLDYKTPNNVHQNAA